MPNASPITKFSAKTAGPGRLRWSLAGLFFIIGLVGCLDRANIAVVAGTMMTDLGMSKTEFGLLGSLFSLGYGLMQIPGGILAERFGSRLIISLGLLLWSLFTILTACAPRFIWLCIVRFLFGIGEAPIYPGNAVFNNWWFRHNEKARAASILLSGSFFGLVIAPPLTVLIMLTWGWHRVFYIFGAIGVLIALIWFTLARDRPEYHPWISSAELEYIHHGRLFPQDGTALKPHWKQLLGHSEFWATGLQYFFVSYISSLFLIWLPTYLQEARGFSLAHMGIAASFPWLAICLCALAGGILSDGLLRCGTSYRKARSHVAIAGLMISIIGTCGVTWSNNSIAVVFWLTLALGSLGLAQVTAWAVVSDKGRQYTGSVGGWMNMWGNPGAVISPTLCGWLVQYYGWNVVLLLNIIPISLAIICWCFVRPDNPFN